MSTPSGAIGLILANAYQRAPDGTLIFPFLRGLSLEFTQRPTFSTIVQTGTDRSTARIQLDPYPLWQYDLAFGYLSDDHTYAVDSSITNPSGLTELEQLMSFFLAVGGQAKSFLFDVATMTKKPENSGANNVLIGLGDGAMSAFQLVRPWGGFLELIENPVLPSLIITVITAAGITGAGSIASCINGLVSLTAPPPAGSSIIASFRFYHRMRFTNDSEDFDSQLRGLYSKSKVKLIQERNATA